MTDSRIRIEIEAEDETGAVLDATKRKVEDVGAGGERAASGLAVFGNAARNSARILIESQNVLTRLDLVQITTQNSAERLQRSQEAAALAVRQHGQNSEEAVRAIQDIGKAQADVDATNRRAALSYVFVAAEVGRIATLIPKVVIGVRAMSAAYVAAAVEAGAFTAVATAGLSVAAVATAFFIQQQMESARAQQVARQETEARMRSEQLFAAALEHRRKAEEFRSSGGPVLPEFTHPFQLAREEDAEGDRLQRLGDERKKFENQQVADAQAFAEALLNQANQEDADRVARLGRDEAYFRRQREIQAQHVRDLTEVLKSLPPESEAAKGVQGALAKAVTAWQQYGQDVQAIMNETAATAKRASDEQAQAVERSAQRAEAAASNVGIRFNELSTDLLQNMARSGGAMSILAARALEARGAEDALIEPMLKSSSALREQYQVTQRKGESTADLATRLRELGFSEDEIREKMTGTLGVVKDQTAAQEALARTSGNVAGPAQSAELTGASTFNGQVSRVAIRQGNDDAFIMDLEDQVNRAVLAGHMNISDANSAVRLLEGVRTHAQGNVFGLGNATLLETLRRAGIRSHYAAAGADFLTQGPTMLLVGENGREHVTVDPSPAPGAPGPSGGDHVEINIEQNIHLPHGFTGDAGAVRRAAARGAAEGLSVAQQRVATRRK